MTDSDKNWAKSYVLDPLTEPQPAEETGPGTHFVRPKEKSSVASSGHITPPYSTDDALKRNTGSTKAHGSYTSPPGNSSPRKSPSHRQEAFGDEPRRRRGSSLGERFPGDMSHRPLDQLAREKAVADRSRHATKKHHIQPDQIDKLDAGVGGSYHHSGPYDATLYARNNSYKSSPVAAVTSTNEETLKATPRERLADSLEGHRPLDGVAEYPPGERDVNGHVYKYEQGENMMVDVNPGGGPYKRWAGIDYHPDDIKGKGEPSYTIEKSLKEHRQANIEKQNRASTDGIEMTSRARSGSGSGTALKSEAFGEHGMGRSGSLSKRLSGSIKRRVGSLKRNSHHED